jgi:hypothetical protein
MENCPEQSAVQECFMVVVVVDLLFEGEDILNNPRDLTIGFGMVQKPVKVFDGHISVDVEGDCFFV